MNKMIAGFLLGVSVSVSVGAFAARDSVDTLVYQHQIEKLQADQAKQAQDSYAYMPGYNTVYGYQSVQPATCSGLPSSRLVVDQWGHQIGVQCPNGQIQYFGSYGR
jgi:hypothetical protein